MVVFKPEISGGQTGEDLWQNTGKILPVDHYVKVRGFLFGLLLVAKIRGQHLSLFADKKKARVLGKLHVLCPKTAEISPIPWLRDHKGIKGLTGQQLLHLVQASLKWCRSSHGALQVA